MASLGEEIGRRSGDGFRERTYNISNATSETDALTALLTGVPADLDATHFLVPSASEVEELEASGIYRGTARWELINFAFGTPPAPVDGSQSVSFQIGLQPYTVTQSITTVNAEGPVGGTTPVFNRAINVDEDGAVKGVQWPISPSQIISHTDDYDNSRVTESYYRSLSRLVGKVNNATHLGFEADELLYLGASGQKRGTGLWQIEHRFGFSENKVNVVTPWSGVIFPEKKGWHYLWYYYETDTDSAAHKIVKRPAAAYIEQIAETASFAGVTP